MTAPAASPRPGVAAQFSSRVNLVEVYATVTDRRGPVSDLRRDDFDVFEDGERQTVTAFAAGKLPLAVALAIDRSFSVPRDRLNRAVAAARRFIDALAPDDRVMLLAIGSEIETLAPLSADHAQALAALNRLEPWGTTPLYDAAIGAVDAIQSAAGRRALILLSDGDDRDSRTTPAEVVDAARRKDVLIYPLAIGRRRPPLFAELASVSGGRSFFVSDPAALAGTLTMIAQELRAQYLLGYTPTRSAGTAAGWRSIRVTVNRPDARVRAREGYFFP